MTPREIYDMYEGFEFRARLITNTIALQTFFTQAMFAKNVTLDMFLASFGQVTGIKKQQ